MSRLHHAHCAPPGDTGPDLFTPPAQPVDTSREAARRVRGHTQRIREGIYLLIRALGSQGATAGELEATLGISGSTIRPRLRELEGDAPWAKLPRRIYRTVERRAGMRVYTAL